MTEFDELCANDPELAELRSAIREFLVADREKFGWEPAIDSWLARWDGEFSARLADAGFVGLTIPTEYGGHGLGHLHRYVVTEELLAHGAPVAAHWFADRQFAPSLLSYGSDEQRKEFLPVIAKGRLHAAIGMSEHDAGSDRRGQDARRAGRRRLVAERHQGVDQRRTSRATDRRAGPHQPARSRTSPRRVQPVLRGAGLPGITIDPIVQMGGEHHFNEVTFDDVFVPDTDVLGSIGDGWRQVTSELGFERSGPERILSTVTLVCDAIRALPDDADDGTAAAVGDLVARMISLRQLSISVARALAAGEDAATSAALVKDLGTRFEQDSVELVADLLDRVDDGRTPEARRLRALLDTARLHSPLFTLRGGTNEVLRGVVARGLGVR